LLVRPTRTVRN